MSKPTGLVFKIARPERSDAYPKTKTPRTYALNSASRKICRFILDIEAPRTCVVHLRLENLMVMPD